MTYVYFTGELWYILKTLYYNYSTVVYISLQYEHSFTVVLNNNQVYFNKSIYSYGLTWNTYELYCSHFTYLWNFTLYKNEILIN